MKTKFAILLALACLKTFSSSAQLDEKNLVKFGYAPFVTNNYINFSYERVLTDRFSAQLTYGYGIPKTELPAQIQDVEGFGSYAFKLTGWKLTPEFRMYLKKEKGAPKGIYLAPYGRFSNSKISTTFDMSIDKNGDGVLETSPGTLELSLSEKGFGLQIGAQWLIKDKVAIDWFWFGPRYAMQTVKLSASNSTLTPTDYAIATSEFNAELANSDIPGVDLTAETDGKAMFIKESFGMPWFRFGFSFGYRF